MPVSETLFSNLDILMLWYIELQKNFVNLNPKNLRWQSVRLLRFSGSSPLRLYSTSGLFFYGCDDRSSRVMSTRIQVALSVIVTAVLPRGLATEARLRSVLPRPGLILISPVVNSRHELSRHRDWIFPAWVFKRDSSVTRGLGLLTAAVVALATSAEDQYERTGYSEVD